MSVDQVERFLYHECGLRGLSGISNDLRELLGSKEPAADLSVRYFVHRVACFAGMLAAALGGVDGFIFTAGIGENAPGIRRAILDKLTWMGIRIDERANETGGPLISQPRQSSVACYVVPTNEELMIARHTLAIVRSGQIPRHGDRQ
jgi:acetate kinase